MPSLSLEALKRTTDRRPVLWFGAVFGWSIVAYSVGFLVPLLMANAEQRTGEYILWCGLVGITAGFTGAAGLLTPMIAHDARWHSRSESFPLLTVMAALTAIGVAGTVAFVWVMPELEPFAATPEIPEPAPTLATIWVLLLQIPVAASLAVLAPHYRNVGFAEDETPSPDDLVSLRRAIQARSLLLNFAGVSVGLAVLATGAMRAARGENAFESEIVWLIGASLSMWLAVLYIPVHVALEKVSQQFLDRSQPINPGGEDVDAVIRRRKALQEEAGMGHDIRDNLKNALAIVAPFGAAVLPTLLRGGP